MCVYMTTPHNELKVHTIMFLVRLALGQHMGVADLLTVALSTEHTLNLKEIAETLTTTAV